MTTMNRNEFFDRWSELHGGAEIRGIVKWWLTISFACARFLQRIRVSANGLTLVGVLLSLGVALALNGSETEPDLPRTVLALFLLIVALAADGIDGSIALITGTESTRGAALDAIADRIAEAFWAHAFILLGAEPVIVILAWLAAQIQEYVRARLGGLGVSEIGVVTLSERPVRASFLAIALVVALIFTAFSINDFLGVSDATWISAVASLWLLFQGIALTQLSRFAVRSTIGSR